MSRHALHPAAPRRRPFRLLTAAVLTLLVAGTVVIKLDAGPRGLQQMAAKAPLIGAKCPNRRLPSTTVSLTVAPEIKATVTRALAPLESRTLADHECVKVSIQAQAPSETIEGAQILPLDRAPDIWMPDSSLWVSRVPRWQVNRDGSFATTPVVVASSQATLDKLGWSKKKNPTWQAALAGTRALAVPNLSGNAAGLSAVIALWQSLGKGDNAQKALAGTVLAAGRAGVPSEQQAIASAQTGSAQAPLLPTSEQAVALANTVATSRSKLVYVHPTGGSPALDYPVLTMVRTVTAASTDDTTTIVDSAGRRERAVRAVVAQLFSAQANSLVRAAGFQIADRRGSATPAPSATPLTATGASGPAPVATGSPVEGLTAPELAALVDRITLLSAPSRQLVIFDLSGSMAAKVANGQSRIQVAGAAANLAGNLLTDQAQVGLWGFSRDLVGKKDIVKILDVAPLGSRDGAVSHRQKINSLMTGAAARLGGNGTALYSTAVAGMKEMNRLYDPRAGNAVVIFTDGANSDSGGPTLKKTLTELGKLYNPKKPVRLICIGIGSDVDLAELNKLSSRAGGVAYPMKDPQQLPGVLFQALNQRKQ
jgi:Ca-activated chloride channel family protein